MDTIAFDRTLIDELTTLEKALEVYHKEKFLTVKRELLEAVKRELQLPLLEFDEETQTKIWQDYHDLFGKAVLGKFKVSHSDRLEEGDIERLERYRRLEGHFEVLSNLRGGAQLYFPTNIVRDNSGKIVRVTHNFLDNEITKRWFEHVYNVLVGREDVRKCSDENCSNFFIRKRRKDKKFCSDTCRKRDWRKKHSEEKL